MKVDFHKQAEKAQKNPDNGNEEGKRPHKLFLPLTVDFIKYIYVSVCRSSMISKLVHLLDLMSNFYNHNRDKIKFLKWYTSDFT